MARKNQKMWMKTPTKQAKPQVPALEKQLITEKCCQLIETEFKPKYIQPPSDKSGQYIDNIYGKWYRNFFYFCCTYKLTDPERISKSFEEKFARLEYIGKDKFNLAYMRHTEKWWEIEQGITLEKCLEEIKTNQILQPY
jgi:hypothetical protein